LNSSGTSELLLIYLF